MLLRSLEVPSSTPGKAPTQTHADNLILILNLLTLPNCEDVRLRMPDTVNSKVGNPIAHCP